MRSEHLNEIKGILILALAIILFASLFSYVPEDLSWFTTHPNVPLKNWIRGAGAHTAGSLFFMLGYSAYFLVVFLFFWSWNLFTSRPMVFTAGRLVSLGVLMSVMSGLFSLTGSAITANRFARGGFTGLVFSDFLVRYCGTLGAYIILFTLMCLCLVVAGEFLVSPLFVRFTRWVIDMARTLREQGVASVWQGFCGWLASFKAPVRRMPKPVKKAGKEGMDPDLEDPAEGLKAKVRKPKEEEVLPPVEQDKGASRLSKIAEAAHAKNAEAAKPQAPTIRIIEPKEAPPKEREDKPLVIGNYQLPPFDLLNDSPKISQDNVQELLFNGAKTLEQTLLSFGVVVKVVDIERGPVITRYELEPAPGIRVQSINSLADDIALAMQASSVRIQAPIPGKNRVGIEVPNGASAAVCLKDVLIDGNIRGNKSKLTLALGKDIAGKPILANLADMPHLLVAGATGAGKTVALNSIITSILYNAAPNEVKFIMVDPKRVELIQYDDIPHMLCPAITDPKKVAAALGWMVAEMDTRYKTLAKHKVRNIAAYHELGFEMPYIVVVVDEFADLMQTSGKVVEGAVVRLAQLARAVGIHLILATQRPSVNVITGVIKANLPARLAFRVNSQVDSRTILDEKGAEDLLGKGDMLFSKPGDPKPVRGQCSFLSDVEIHRVMDFIRAQQKPTYDDSVTARQASSQGGNDERDEIFDDAVRTVMETGQASTSMLQRRLGLGFSRAGRIIDQMERAGFVGPSQGSKAREILIDREKWLIDNMTKDASAPTIPEPPDERTV